MKRARTRERPLVWVLVALLFVVGVAGAVVTACGSCTAIGLPGLEVTVADGASGAPVCDATVTAQDGDYETTLNPVSSGQGDCSYVGAYERPGTYTVTATLGARSKVATAVRVSGGDSGGCHVATQSVTITLDP